MRTAAICVTVIAGLSRFNALHAYVVATLTFFLMIIVSIAVITVEPAGKASFVLGCIQTRLMGQYNGK